ncbi:hypothetical protein H8B06_18630 [Sphingobacterium sp. DN00404]|uniref:Four helix bundle protein n=1 Tax=Sphingobacterium micropteri TaxID=2763501 RepID=A0ABR7YU14_9SPHI|nr:hypothetical protein [Sphingobacterium micropteri]MBD1434846.1 hypothetical protein [Sphingobacterium micropteri]
MRTKGKIKAESLIIDAGDQIDNVASKLFICLRTAKRLNDAVVRCTSENFKEDNEYERIQNVFDISCELELVIENLHNLIGGFEVSTTQLINAVQKLRNE